MGDIDDPPVLLIMGLGAQLLLWRTAFCEKLVGQGLRVIRYDNRDVGLSSKTEHRGSGQPLVTAAGPLLAGPAAARRRTRSRTWPTTPRPCSITWASSTRTSSGASMGGMIAQIFAARFRERTKTLAIIFSSNNSAVPAAAGPARVAGAAEGPAAGFAARGDHRQRGARRQHHRQPALPRARRAGPRRGRARGTTVTTTRKASPGISARCWAAAACVSTTGGPSRRPS